MHDSTGIEQQKTKESSKKRFKLPYKVFRNLALIFSLVLTGCQSIGPKGSEQVAEATAQAYAAHPDALKVDIENLPEVIKERSIFISMSGYGTEVGNPNSLDFSKPVTGFSSAVWLGPNFFVTAAHALPAYGTYLVIEKPGTLLSVGFKEIEFYVFRHQTQDMALVVVNVEDDQLNRFWGNQVTQPLEFASQPLQIGQQLDLLTYYGGTEEAPMRVTLLPLSLTVAQPTDNYALEHPELLWATGPGINGQSGSGVYVMNGEHIELVGLHKGYIPGTTEVGITPINPGLTELLERISDKIEVSSDELSSLLNH